MGLPAKISITNSNYIGYSGNVETWETVRVSQNIPILKGATVSADVGLRQYTDWDENGIHTSSSPAFQAMGRVKFSDHTRGYIRYRNYDQTEQVRIAGGASFPVTDNLSVYGDLHGTMKKSMDYNSTPSYTAGGWVGFSYDSKSIPGLNIWCDALQVNAKLGEIKPDENRVSFAGNFGVSYNF